MKVKFNEFLATVYASLFDFPLGKAESRLWAIGTNKKLVYPLKKDEDARQVRRERIKTTLEKRKLAEKIAQMISHWPTVEGVFLTGSVAAWNALPRADIDLMIITTANTLWLTRMAVVGLLKITGNYRSRDAVTDKVCTNIFLDTNHLKIEEKNLYTAHEILQAQCLFDRCNVKNRWLRENFWVEKYLPKAYIVRMKTEKVGRETFFDKLRKYWYLILWPGELVALVEQVIYMKPRMTREKISWGRAIFHPNDLSAKIFKKWSAKLRLLKYNRDEATKIFFSKYD